MNAIQRMALAVIGLTKSWPPVRRPGSAANHPRPRQDPGGDGEHQPAVALQGRSGNLVGYDVDMGHLLAKAIFDDPEKVEYVIQGSDARIPNVLTDKVDITCQFMTVTAGARSRSTSPSPITGKASGCS